MAEVMSDTESQCRPQRGNSRTGSKTPPHGAEASRARVFEASFLSFRAAAVHWDSGMRSMTSAIGATPPGS